MSDVLVVGCGLIGTSVGLALQDSEWGDVALDDRDSSAVATAVARGAGRRWDGNERARVVVVATPPKITASVLVSAQRRDLGQTYTHVCSVQSYVQGEVETLSSDPSPVVGGHPLAGREVSGPEGALLDLFVGRPWAVCPAPTASEEAIGHVIRLAQLCGAVPLRVAPDEHDAAVALMSHLPQLTASALAGLLTVPALADELPLALAGPGLVDTTRLAGSSPELWTEILTANAAHVLPALRELVDRLRNAGEALERLANGGHDGSDAPGASAALTKLLAEGNDGRSRVPIKRGEVAGSFAAVRVDVADEPGQLAAVLSAAGASGVNVEDVRVEHVPGRPRGIIELQVAAPAEVALRQALSRDGWLVV